MVYVGGSGGEYGIRGRLTALDAKTGKIKWRFYTIPGAGRNRSRQLAGEQRLLETRRRRASGTRRRWTRRRNMVYFSTSNAGA